MHWEVGCIRGTLILVKALEAIVVFSVTGAFVVLAGGEAMLGVLAEIRRQQLEKGREEGRKEVLEWIREQEEAGVRFKEPPPYSPENQQLEKVERREERKCSNGLGNRRKQGCSLRNLLHILLKVNDPRFAQCSRCRKPPRDAGGFSFANTITAVLEPWDSPG